MSITLKIPGRNQAQNNGNSGNSGVQQRTFVKVKNESSMETDGPDCTSGTQTIVQANRNFQPELNFNVNPQLKPLSHPYSSLPRPFLPPLLYTMDPDPSTGLIPDHPTISVPEIQSAMNFDSAKNNPVDSMAKLSTEVYETRLQMQEDHGVNTGTARAYKKEVEKYVTFWENENKRRRKEAVRVGQTWDDVPAHPITWIKVASFLKYEANRCKLTTDGKPIPNSRPGPSSIKGTISALENYRYLHERDPVYASCPDALIKLRSKPDISFYETFAQGSEHQRREQSQENKIKGILSDTYTTNELTKMSVWYLKAKYSEDPSVVTINLRDRAMVLMSAAFCLRGDTLRPIQWSNLYLCKESLVEIGPDFVATGLAFTADQGKTNKTGRVDKHGAFRHRIPEHCAIGALAMYLFAMFHIKKDSEFNKVSFAPSYDHPKEYKEYGYREWYSAVLFPGGKSVDTPMTYENHQNRVVVAHKENDIRISKITHAPRIYCANKAMRGGASEPGTMALGLWLLGAGPFRRSYHTDLPIDALLAAAGYIGSRQTSYFVARDVLEVPSDVSAAIFPWVEVELKALQDRIEARGWKAEDSALASFLEVVLFLRRVLIQDAAVLSTKYPGLPIFNYFPFNTESFRSFASKSAAIISRAEEEARLKLMDLPEPVAQSIRGALTINSMNQQQHQARVDEQMEDMKTFMQYVRAEQESASVKGKKRKAKKDHPESEGRPAPALRDHSVMDLINTTMEPLPPQPPPSAEPKMGEGSTPPKEASQSSFVVSSSTGAIYSIQTFPVSTNLDVRAEQMKYIANLELTFEPDKLKLHRFEWVTASGKEKRSEWLPVFEGFWKPKPDSTCITREEIWKEYKEGMDGKFSIQEMNAQWEARWKRNSKTIKGDYQRRIKIVKLVEQLTSKPGWDIEMTWRFLNERYPISSSQKDKHLKRTRAFIEFLQSTKECGEKKVLEEADSYVPEV